MVINLGSASLLNDQEMEPNVPYPIKSRGDKVEFGQSTRSYVISVDYSAMQREAEEALRQMEIEMTRLEKLNSNEELDVETFKSSFGLVKQDTLYVCNIPYHYEEADLAELFKDCGEVKNVSIPEDRMTRKNRGYAFVTLDSDRAARKGLNYDGHKVLNRPLKVTLAQPDKQQDSRQRVRESDRGRPSRRDDGGRGRDRDRQGRRRSRSGSRERRPRRRSSESSTRRDKHRERRSHGRREDRYKKRNHSASDSEPERSRQKPKDRKKDTKRHRK